jgi:hypothetical protein
MEDVLAAFAELESTVECFDDLYADYDFSTLTFEQIILLERKVYHYPAEKVRNAVHRARVAAANREYEEQERREDLILARYGYYNKAGASRGLCLSEVRAYERATVRALYDIMEGASDEEIREAIKRYIPSITNEEIDDYRKQQEVI